MPEIDQYLSFMIQSGASDFHLRSGVKPMFRVNGRMAAPTGKSATPFTPEMVSDIVGEIMPDRNQKEFNDCRDTDFAYSLGDDGRFRVNVFQDREGVGAVFRHIPQKIMTLEELGLPPAVQKLCGLGKGIVLVTGPTGSGKTTTLAAMIDYINNQRTDHVVTIEDPIEFVHENKKCLITQREVHHHTDSFKKALRAALPIETAETGHLVLATRHTTTAWSTVDRVIDQIPSDRLAHIRTMLSVSLKGVISQTLCRRKDGKGRVAALEILIGTPAIANNIRDGKTYQIPSSIQTGRKLGMQTLNDSLLDLVKRDLVDPAEAYRQSVDKSDMSSKLKVGGF
ncbi:MAG: type IV pilus twitching motility protein PilT [Planctomycetota bacterium]|jgi:twitching motility protein PilT